VEAGRRRAAQRRSVREISSSDGVDDEESTDLLDGDEGAPMHLRGPAGPPKAAAGACVYVCVALCVWGGLGAGAGG